MKTITKTRVQVTIEVEGGAPFDETFNIGQVYSMSRESALQALRGGVISINNTNFRIIGSPKVLAVTTEVEP